MTVDKDGSVIEDEMLTEDEEEDAVADGATSGINATESSTSSTSSGQMTPSSGEFDSLISSTSWKIFFPARLRCLIKGRPNL
jgi:hypothetical protein